MRHFLPIVIPFLMLSATVNGQNENKIWYFGQNAGMDFNSGTAVALTNGSLNTPADNTAAISDASGNILFYSEGTTVWNSQHNVMSNGTGLLGHQSGGQPATIVPHPGNPNLYYLFTVDAWAWSNGIRYSIIDMSQQSGLGAVTATKNVQLYTPATEKVIAVRHCNRRDYWLITHMWNSNTFNVYLIDNNGLNTTPVQTSIGTVHTGGTSGFYNAAGQINVSESGSRVALAIYDMGAVELFDFDNSTGVLSNPVQMTGFSNAWGVEFSPDEDVLYVSQWVGSQIKQLNLLAGNAAAIQASSQIIGNASSPNGSYQSSYMKRGPDGKIYIAKYTSNYLAVVNNPDVLGSGCNFVDNGFYLGGQLSTAGLDNCVFQSFQPPAIVFSGNCNYSFGLTDTTDVLSANWNFGDPSSGPANISALFSPTHTFSSSGTYTVQVILSYTCRQDTITQSVNAVAATQAQFTSASGLCGTSINFTNNSVGATSYSWDFGDSNGSTATSPSHIYTAAGTYTITLIATGPCGIDTTASIITISPSVVSATFNASSSGCTSIPVSFTNTSSGATSYSWDFGDTGTSTSASPAHLYAASGTYTVTLIASSACDADTITQVITVNQAPVASITGSDSICQGQSLVLTASGGTSVQWSGGSTATTSSINVSPAVNTTYYATVSNGTCSSVPDTFTVSVFNSPVAIIVGPNSICSGQSVTLTATGNGPFQWSGGSSATTSSITVSPSSATTYYVTPASSGVCPAVSDTLNLAVLPTPIVNVGGNTLICAGQSTTLTASGGTSYQWSGGSSDTTVSITVSPVVTTTYFVSTSNGACSSGFDTITVTVQPTPTVSIIGNTAICPGSSTTLTGMGATTYQWQGGITTVGQTVTVSPTTNTNYYLIGYNSQGCADTTMVTIIVYDPPTVAILGDDSICAGESTQLLCTGNGTFAWSPPTGLSSTSSQNVTATPSSTITYSVQATNINGCTGSSTFTVFVDACTGIGEQAGIENDLRVYPNPGNGTFYMEWKTAGMQTIEIFDARGRLVLSGKQAQSPFMLDLRNQPDGAYLLKLSGEENYRIHRLVIAR
ncbi:MAG: hypothetical protein FD123_1342 [Bacteroidetes bacterium]|nr:MAG: hypothetical protein FD123_1342 [Bacteroidota bacterium]